MSDSWDVVDLLAEIADVGRDPVRGGYSRHVFEPAELELRAWFTGRGFVPARPVAVVAFAEEEGSRFGIACLGSKLMTGAVDPGLIASRADAAGGTFAQAAAPAGGDPAG